MGLSQSEAAQIAAAAKLINLGIALTLPPEAIYQATWKAICYWQALDEHFIDAPEIAKRTLAQSGLKTLPSVVSQIHMYLKILKENGVAIKFEERPGRGKPVFWATTSSGTSSEQ